MKRLISVVLVAFWIVGCKDRYKITNEYYLWTTEGMDHMMLCYLDYGEYNIGVIGPCAFAAGQDGRHIIVKEHPFRDGKVDKATTLYYIVPLVNKISSEPQKNYYGPYSQAQFEKMRGTLGVSRALDFSTVIWQLK